LEHWQQHAAHWLQHAAEDRANTVQHREKCTQFLNVALGLVQ
jgi:hypothetical protein